MPGRSLKGSLRPPSRRPLTPRAGEDRLGLGDRERRAVSPVRSGCGVVRAAQHLDQAEQDLEVVGLSLHRLVEVRRHEQRRAAVGAVAPLPGAGDVSFAGRLVVARLILPITVFDGEAAGLGEARGLVGPVAVDRQAIR